MIGGITMKKFIIIEKSENYKHNTWFEVVEVDIPTGEIMIDDGVSFNGEIFNFDIDLELNIVEPAE